MIAKIGEVAGRIWELLNHEGTKSVAELPKALNGDPMLVFQGLGWLAREGKVEFGEREEGAVVSLSGR